MHISISLITISYCVLCTSVDGAVKNLFTYTQVLDFVFSWGGYKSMGLGKKVSSGIQGQNPCKGPGTVSQKLNHFDMCIALFCP